MQGRISNIVPLFLITIISIVAVEGLYQGLEFFVFKSPEVSKDAPAQKATTVRRIKDSAGQKPDYRIILKRNLFGRSTVTPTTEPVIEKTVNKTPTELGIVLMGTISGSDNSNRAIIFTKKTRDQEIFSSGEVIEGALIKEIQRGKLVLTINGKDEILDMSEAAEMRPVYKAPRPLPSKNSEQPAGLERNDASSNLNSTPAPRRRVVRRPRTTQNRPRPTAN